MPVQTNGIGMVFESCLFVIFINALWIPVVG